MDEELITEYVIADCATLPISDKAWHVAEYLRNLKNDHPLNCYDHGFSYQIITLNTPVSRYINSNFMRLRFDELVWRFVEAYFSRSDQVHRLLAYELFASYKSKSIEDLFQEFVDAELEKLDQILWRIDSLILTRYSVERSSGSLRLEAGGEPARLQAILGHSYQSFQSTFPGAKESFVNPQDVWSPTSHEQAAKQYGSWIQEHLQEPGQLCAQNPRLPKILSLYETPKPQLTSPNHLRELHLLRPSEDISSVNSHLVDRPITIAPPTVLHPTLEPDRNTKLPYPFELNLSSPASSKVDSGSGASLNGPSSALESPSSSPSASTPATATATATATITPHEEQILCSFKNCGRTFKHKHELNRHLKSHIRPEHCPHCGRGFETSKDVERHVNSVHETKVKYYCTFAKCNYSRAAGINGKWFPRKDNLGRHVRRKHGIGGEELNNMEKGQETVS